MTNINLDTFNEHSSIVVSITTILNALKKYEVRIPREYFKEGKIHSSIESWLFNEIRNGNLTYIASDNTCNMAGKVSAHFGFTQYDSLVSEDNFILLHVHNGEPFLDVTGFHDKYVAVLLKLKKGNSFYDLLDNITFEDTNVPSMNIQVNGKHYLVLPRVVSESYYVKCIETGEELEATNEIWFYGNESDVKNQIESYIKMQRKLILS